MPKTSNTSTEAAATLQAKTLKEVAKELGLTEFRVRTAIREGDLQTTMEPVKEGSKTNRHMITAEAVAEWRSHTGNHTRRADGRNKFNIYMTVEEYDVVLALMKENKIELPIERANTKKVSEPEIAEA